MWCGGQVCLCGGVFVFMPTGSKGTLQPRVAYCKKAHNFQMDSQTSVERLVMSQRTADCLFGPTSKKGGMVVGAACNKKAHNF